MNYLDLIKKFWSEDTNISYSSICVYFYLLELWDNNNGEDIEISDYKLNKTLNMSKATITKSKKELRNLGLISFHVIQGYSTIYKINTEYTLNKKQQQPKKQEPKPKKETLVQPEIKEEPKEKTKEIVPVPTIAEPKQEENIIEVVPPIKEVELPKPVAVNRVAEKKENISNKSNGIPTLDEFMEYARTLPPYESSLDFALETKYEMWQENGWKNGYNMPIKNWKTSLKSAIPYLKSGMITQPKAPKINRPKSTYNE